MRKRVAQKRFAFAEKRCYVRDVAPCEPGVDAEAVTAARCPGALERVTSDDRPPEVNVAAFATIKYPQEPVVKT